METNGKVLIGDVFERLSDGARLKVLGFDVDRRYDKRVAICCQVGAPRHGKARREGARVVRREQSGSAWVTKRKGGAKTQFSVFVDRLLKPELNVLVLGLPRQS